MNKTTKIIIVVVSVILSFTLLTSSMTFVWLAAMKKEEPPAPPAVCKITFDIGYKGAKNPPEQKVNNGKFATIPTIEKREGYQFAGWFLDKESMDWTKPFDFAKTPIKDHTTLYAIWVDMKSDSDGDGLSDDIEDYKGTDKNKKDTDGDGLTDYQEVIDLGTSPLKKDTDGNGTNDYDEDNDGDTLSNGYEYSIETNPLYVDSDHDSLKDNDELDTYSTSPSNADTDEDGADDGWEIDNGYDPLEFNDSFSASVSSISVSENNTVAASVELELEGEQIASLNIEPVSVVDNPFISTSVPGYLGAAYDFTVEGDISFATLTFEYDSSLGTLNEDFQPRIYYFNEETKTFEELPDQKVSEGVVQAETTHFSTYMLLNKAAFDAVWYTEIKEPLLDESGSVTGIDVAFVLDKSGSMGGDRIITAKDAINSFIDLLEEHDRAAFITFADTSTTRISLTDDKTSVKNKVSGIYASGGTAIYSGLEKGLAELTNPSETYGYKMIILLSDGEDSYSTSYESDYAHLVQTAIDNNIVIYSIGVGDSVDVSILSAVAYNSGGAYYHASYADEIANAFYKIQEETVDLVTDTNNDGIPDYYSELIKSGELVLSNGSRQFEYVDFTYDESGNVCDDHDGDGLKNGEELQVVLVDDRVYLYMKSNPLQEHSDSDNVDDFTEVTNGTDPLMYQTNNTWANKLYDDDNFYYTYAVQTYDEDWLFQLDAEFLAAVFGVWNKDELYRDIMIDYFYQYGGDDYIDEMAGSELKIMALDVLAQYLPYVKKYATSPYKEIERIYKLTSQLNALSSSSEISSFMTNTFKPFIDSISSRTGLDTAKISLFTHKMKDSTSKFLEKTSKAKSVQWFCKGVTYTLYAVDIYDTVQSFSKLSANAHAYEANIDILVEIRDHSSDSYARDAATDLISTLSGEMSEQIFGVAGDIGEAIGKEVIKTLAKKNVYVLAFVVIRDGFDIIFAISTELKQQFQMMCYERMSTAIINLYDTIAIKNGSYIYLTEESIPLFKRYMTHLAQIRILGEKKYCEWQAYEGVLGWFIDNTDTEEKINSQVETIKNYADYMGLELASAI